MSAVGSILTNTGALQALNSIANTSSTNSSLESQLSSGLSINSPSDNPAGYITAQGFTSQLNGLTQAISNANQGVSLLQTAQGAIGQQIGVVQQLNSIAVQASNGTQTAAESQSLQNLASKLTGQVSTIANQTQFNNISLLDGSFQGKQFQVGANEGQTLNLSIASTSAGSIGMNYAKAAGYTTGTANTASGAPGSAQVTLGAPAAATGLFSGGAAASITGANGGTASVTAAAAGTSAATLAAQVNAVSSTTGVAAQASTSVTLSLNFGATTPGMSFNLQSDTGSGTGLLGSAQSINAASANQLVSQINGKSNTSGIVASLNSSGGKLTLTQTAGQNIDITSFTGSGSLKTQSGAPAAIKSTAGSAVIQGQMQLQSSGAFSVTNGANIGVANSSTLASLSDINVSNTAGASQAINVVKYALAALNNQGGNLGAVQQSLTANINNMNTTSQNLTTALGVVQDANIPQVSNRLTQSQIQAQAGVAALKSSTQLQQSYLSLLP
ncbi:MAG TPA: flagellin [Acidocella sp.]|nr:flagellin [Acidocella sp.]